MKGRPPIHPLIEALQQQVGRLQAELDILREEFERSQRKKSPQEHYQDAHPDYKPSCPQRPLCPSVPECLCFIDAQNLVRLHAACPVHKRQTGPNVIDDYKPVFERWSDVNGGK